MGERDTLLEAISAVESGNDPQAVGDQGRSLGAFQMHPIAYREVQRHFPEFQAIPYEALRNNPTLQRQAAERYLRVGEQVYGIQDVDRLISFYNAGPQARRGALINPGYVRKVKAHMGNPIMGRFQ